MEYNSDTTYLTTATQTACSTQLLTLLKKVLHILYKVKNVSLQDYNKVNRKKVTILRETYHTYRFKNRKAHHENNFSDI